MAPSLAACRRCGARVLWRSALQPYVAPLLRTLATDRSALLQLRRGALHLLQVVVLGSHTVLINQWARL